MNRQQISVCFDPVLKDQLKELARKRSYLSGREISWVGVLHEAAEKLLESEKAMKCG